MRRSGDKVGDWVLEEELGGGGSAVVWRARRRDGVSAAVKMLKTRNPESDLYKRFATEIAVLNELREHPGVLPLLGFALPKRPTRASPAWFAMPVAELIRDALGESPRLEEVVAAVGSLAVTLADLGDEGISHRDLKPANLYRYRGGFVLGDFGLVDFPDKEEITRQEDTLGPVHFLAPEMLQDPVNADGRKADVYSLAKVLWVLATGQPWPPQGQIRSEVEETRLSFHSGHLRAYLLDRLIERSTSIPPGERLGMRDFADELAAWLQPPKEGTGLPPDLTERVQRVAERVAVDRRRGKQLVEWMRQATDLSNSIGERVAPIAEILRASDIPTRDIVIPDTWEVVDLVLGNPNPGPEKALGGASVRTIGSTVEMRNGIALRLLPTGTLEIAAAHYFFMDDGRRILFRVSSWKGAVGSALAERALDELSGWLLDTLPEALDEFARLLA